MKRLRIASMILFFIAFAGFILWRFVFPFPDWLVRVSGIVMLIAIFISVFSTAKIAMNKTEPK